MSNNASCTIAAIEVTNLLGCFNYSIRLCAAEHLTILIAPNGYGKTSLLRLVDAFFNSRYAELARVPFERLRFRLRDGSNVTADFVREDDERVLRVRCSRPDAPEMRRRTTIRARTSDYSFQEMARMHGFRQIRPRRWHSPQFGPELLTTEELASLIEDDSPRSREVRVEEPSWLAQLRESTRVVFIDSERLRMRSGRERPDRDEAALAYYAKVVSERIADASRLYSEQSQNLDRSFPKRLVTAMRSGKSAGLGEIDMTGIAQRLDRLAARYDELAVAGLVDAKSSRDFLSHHELEEVDRRVMQLYLEDNEQKLAVFADISARIEALYSILRGRFLNKELRVDRRHGLLVRGASGPLELSQLSSGEQHQVRIWSQLLFDVRAGSLVLIDEPEISLHVAWQKAFLQDLEKVNRVAGLEFMIATHSPQIVSNRPSVAVELNRGEEE